MKGSGNMKKLGILMARYKEPMDMVKTVLDSINNQNIDFTKIKVTLMNDGQENLLNKSEFDDYNFEFEYIAMPRSGTSKMRNRLLDYSKEEFIWFLDPDDEVIEDSLHKLMNLLEDKKDVDLVLSGALWENKKGVFVKFFPNFESYSIMGCSIMRRQFLLDKNICADESTFLAGDIMLEHIPKFYTDKKILLRELLLKYKYHPKSAVNDKSNGWREESKVVMSNLISRLLIDQKIKRAYTEYKKYVVLYNSLYIRDRFKNVFVELGLYDLNFKMDLR